MEADDGLQVRLELACLPLAEAPRRQPRPEPVEPLQGQVAWTTRTAPELPVFAGSKPFYVNLGCGLENQAWWIGHTASALLEQLGHDPALLHVALGSDLSRYNWLGAGRDPEPRLATFSLGPRQQSTETRGLHLAALRQHQQGRGIVHVFGWELANWSVIDIDCRISTGDTAQRRQEVRRLLLIVAIIKHLFPNCMVEARYEPASWRALMSAKRDWCPVLHLDDDRLVHHHPDDPTCGIAGVHAWVMWPGWYAIEPLRRHLTELLRRAGVEEVSRAAHGRVGERARHAGFLVEIRPQERHSIALPLRPNRDHGWWTLGYQLVDHNLIPQCSPVRLERGALRWRSAKDALAANWQLLDQTWRPDSLPAALAPLPRIPTDVTFRRRREASFGHHVSREWIEVDRPRDLLERSLHVDNERWPHVRLPDYPDLPAFRQVANPPSAPLPAAPALATPARSEPANPRPAAVSGNEVVLPTAASADPFTPHERYARIGAIVVDVKARGGTVDDAEALVRAAHVGATCAGSLDDSLRDLRGWWRAAAGRTVHESDDQKRLWKRRIQSLLRAHPPPGYARNRQRVAKLLLDMLFQTHHYPHYAERFSLGYHAMAKRGFASSRQITAIKHYLAALGCTPRSDLKVQKGRAAERWDVRPLVERLRPESQRG